jgi:RNA polymerase sigma factor (sigma-70 family)
MRACLDRLPATLGDAVRLFYLEELSGAETAERLATNAATVRKRLQRARAELATCIRARLANDPA